MARVNRVFYASSRVRTRNLTARSFFRRVIRSVISNRSQSWTNRKRSSRSSRKRCSQPSICSRNLRRSTPNLPNRWMMTRCQNSSNVRARFRKSWITPMPGISIRGLRWRWTRSDARRRMRSSVHCQAVKNAASPCAACCCKSPTFCS